MRKIVFCFVTALVAFCCVANAQKIAAIGSGTDSVVTCPVNTIYGYSLVEQLYLSSELNMPDGSIITSLSFYHVRLPDTTTDLNRTITVYLQNTEKSAFGNSSDYVTPNKYDKVFSGRMFATSSGWLTLHLDVPFVYTGGNLLLAISDNTGVANGQNFRFRSHNTAKACRLSFYQNKSISLDSLSSYASKTTSTVRSNIRIGYMECVSSPINVGNGMDSMVSSPTNTLYKYSIVECLYQESELNIPSGAFINSLSYYHVKMPDATTNLNRSVVIYIENTSKSSFSSKKDYITPSGSSRVFSGKMSATSSGWVTINLDKSFRYEGGNIVIAFDDNTGSGTGQSLRFRCHTTSSNSRITFYSDSENQDIRNLDSCTSSSTVSKSRPNIRIGYRAPENAATIPYSCDFKTKSENQNWTTKNTLDDRLAAWRICNGKMFINGHNPKYRSVTVLAERLLDLGYWDSLNVSFDCHVNGDYSGSSSAWDYIAVFLVPSDTDWQPNVDLTSPEINYIKGYNVYDLPYVLHFGSPASVGNTKIASSNGRLSTTIANPAPGKKYRLVFVWRNDNTGGPGEGAAISNLSVSGIIQPAEYTPKSTAQWYGYTPGISPANLGSKYVTFTMQDLTNVTPAMDTTMESHSATTFAGGRVWFFTYSPVKIGNAFVDNTKNHIYGFKASDMNSGTISTVRSVSFNPVDGKLYFIDSKKLYRMDTNDMEHFTVMGTLDSSIITFAIDANGDAYGITLNTGNLLKVNLNNAGLTLVGSTGVNKISYIQSMAFDYNTGELFWAQCGNNLPDRVYYVDVKTGKAKIIGTLACERGMELTGLFTCNIPDAIREVTSGVLSVYPNPASGVLHIRNAKGGKLQVVDVTGRQIMSRQLPGNEEEFSLDISSLATGIYFLKIGSGTAKFVKE